MFFCLSFVFGVAASSFLTISQILLLGFLILGIFLVSVFWQRKKLVVVGFCLLFLALGVWRHQAVISETIHPLEKETTFIATVIQEPDVREDNAKLTLREAEPRSIQGKILVTVNRYPEYQYGDKLKITGKLQIPQEFPDFNYQDYLAKDGIYSVMYYPKVELVAANQGNFIYAKILQLKDRLREPIEQNLSPPQSSILAALLLGDKRKMSADLKEDLNQAGVRHITAISGMHVMILMGILMYLGLGLGLSRSRSFYFTLLLLGLFIVMIGLPSSAVRAGIMGGFFLLAQKLGRPQAGVRAVVFAAVGMLAFNPLLLKSDVGFQLSFLAVMGIIYLTPFLQRFLKFRVLAMTLAAQIFTLPILIYNFGYFSKVAVLTNVLIVPLLAYLMGLGFIFILAGLIFQPLGWLLSWPIWLLLTYITKIVEFFSK